MASALKQPRRSGQRKFDRIAGGCWLAIILILGFQLQSSERLVAGDAEIAADESQQPNLAALGGQFGSYDDDMAGAAAAFGEEDMEALSHHLDSEADGEGDSVDIDHHPHDIEDRPMESAAPKLKKSNSVTIPLQSVPFEIPATDKLDFVEMFHDSSDDSIFKRWIRTDQGKFTGTWKIAERMQSAIVGDKGLRLMEGAKHHGIFTRMGKPFEFVGRSPLVLSYEVKFEEGLNCGGAYLKLFDSAELSKQESEQFSNETPYVIMFGPDRCGPTNKVHFIIRRLNPTSQTWVEHHLKNPPILPKPDSVTHQYGFALLANNQYLVSVDNVVAKQGSLDNDFEPPLLPPEFIDDPEDKVPADWEWKTTIPDPNAVQPDDWDERMKIPDPNVEMPGDWLEDEPVEIVDENDTAPETWDEAVDGLWVPKKTTNPKCATVSGCGKWSPPMISNPNFKGKWSAPTIPNPNYKGPFIPRTISNPAYFEHTGPWEFAAFDAVGFELWTIESGILFDNVVVAHEKELVDKFVQKTWQIRNRIEREGVEKQAAATEKELQAMANSPSFFEINWWKQMWDNIAVGSQIIMHEYPMAATVGAITIAIMVVVSIMRVFKRPTGFAQPTASPVPKRVDSGQGESTESSSRKTSEESTGPREAQPDSDEGSETVADSPDQAVGAVRRRRTATKRD